YPHVQELLKEYRKNGLTIDSTQAQRERALFLAMRVDDILQAGKTAKDNSSRLAQLVALEIPYKGKFLDPLLDRSLGEKDPVYMAAKKLYDDMVLNQDSELYRAFPTFERTDGAGVNR